MGIKDIFKKSIPVKELDALEKTDSFKNMIGELKNLQEQITAKGLHGYYNGKSIFINTISEKDMNYNVSLSNLESSINGRYDSVDKTIEINSDLVRRGKNITPYGLHEFMHGITEVISKHIDKYPVESAERQCLAALNSNIECVRNDYDLFGIPVRERAYVDLSIQKGVFVDESNRISMLYYLSPIERFSFTAEKMMYEKNKDFRSFSKIESIENDAFDYFLLRYKTSGLTKRDICNHIDSAYKTIQSQSKCKNDLEAAIAYDIAAIMAMQRNDISIDEFHKITQLGYMTNVLAEYGFVMPGSDAIKYNSYVVTHNMGYGIANPEMLKKMNEQQQINNPMVIANTLLLYKDEAAKYLINKDAFAAWYYSNDNPLQEYDRNKIAEILGPEFSNEYSVKINLELYPQKGLETVASFQYQNKQYFEKTELDKDIDYIPDHFEYPEIGD